MNPEISGYTILYRVRLAERPTPELEARIQRAINAAIAGPQDTAAEELHALKTALNAERVETARRPSGHDEVWQAVCHEVGGTVEMMRDKGAATSLSRFDAVYIANALGLSLWEIAHQMHATAQWVGSVLAQLPGIERNHKARAAGIAKAA